MSKPVSTHVAIRNDFRSEGVSAFKLNQELESIIAIKSKGSGEVFHGKVDHSQPPWNAQAAGLIVELHAWVRRTERLWRDSAGLPVRYRGGSNRNTLKGLEALSGLSEALDDELVREDRAWLTSWCRRAQIILGEKEAVKRLPRNIGEREAKCPWCKRSTLRQRSLEGMIFCIDPRCKDEDGKHPQAYLECFKGEWVLRWMDGVLGSP